MGDKSRYGMDHYESGWSSGFMVGVTLTWATIILFIFFMLIFW